jgi:hypothetical protein
MNGVGPQSGLVDGGNAVDQPAGGLPTDPLLAMAGLANGTIGAGGGRCTRSGADLRPALRAWVTDRSLWAVYRPPGGAWWLYHSFSTQLTMLAPPCSRAHSARRGLSELPMAGLVRALPREMASQISRPAQSQPDADHQDPAAAAVDLLLP